MMSSSSPLPLTLSSRRKCGDEAKREGEFHVPIPRSPPKMAKGLRQVQYSEPKIVQLHPVRDRICRGSGTSLENLTGLYSES